MIRDGEDDLDSFRGASFIIGNQIRFDLRVYRGHPQLTVTLYLPDDVSDDQRVNAIIDAVIQEMFIPPTAVAWRRGQPFKYGELGRPKGDRLREPEARLLVLKIAAKQPNRAASTQFLKSEVPRYIELSPQDRLRSKSRPREEMWQQIVGNVLSHKGTRDGPFAKGYATRTRDGLSVTKEGLAYLKSIGFSIAGADLDDLEE